jgi:hypothetical protein
MIHISKTRYITSNISKKLFYCMILVIAGIPLIACRSSQTYPSTQLSVGLLSQNDLSEDWNWNSTVSIYSFLQPSTTRYEGLDVTQMVSQTLVGSYSSNNSFSFIKIIHELRAFSGSAPSLGAINFTASPNDNGSKIDLSFVPAGLSEVSECVSLPVSKSSDSFFACTVEIRYGNILSTFHIYAGQLSTDIIQKLINQCIEKTDERLKSIDKTISLQNS